MNKFDETMKMVVVDEGDTPPVEQNFKHDETKIMDAIRQERARIMAEVYQYSYGHQDFMYYREAILDIVTGAEN